MPSASVAGSSIEQTIQNWLQSLPAVTSLVPESQWLTGDQQSDSPVFPYVVITSEPAEPPRHTSNARLDDDAVTMSGYFRQFEDGKAWMEFVKTTFDRSAFTGDTITVRQSRYESSIYEQQNDGEWLFDIVFRMKYQRDA